MFDLNGYKVFKMIFALLQSNILCCHFTKINDKFVEINISIHINNIIIIVYIIYYILNSSYYDAM
jgi:hypothetical protein